MTHSLPSVFAGLTFDILAAWAGEAAFQRGRVYHKAGKVRDIALTPEGGLLATVQGSRKYATLFFQEKNGELGSLCTCPYGSSCKHAVALACAGLALFAAKTPIPFAVGNDKRLLDLEIAASPDETAPPEDSPSRQELEAALKTLSKEQLRALVMQIAGLVPEAAAMCLAPAKPRAKDALALVKEARKAIRKATQAPDWDYDYRGSPDYEPVRKKLEALRLSGFFTEVIELGSELLEDSMSQIEMYDDEGELHDDIALCMDIVFQALLAVDWPLSKKLLWAADAVLADGFAICECFQAILNEKHDPEAWNPVADALLQRLAQHEGKGFSRRALCELAAHALAAAGREAEIIDLHRNEALHYGEYLPLVQYLLEKNKDRETEEWIHKGIAALEQKEPYTAQQLRSCLLDLRKKQNDWDAVLCMQTEDFVRRASLKQFRECRGSAAKLGLWPVLRPLLMEFLIERKIPWTQDAWPCRNRGQASLSRGEKHPDFTTLVDLAIAEKNPAEVLKWYDLQCQTQGGYGYNADSVATAVQDFAPERAIALWKGLAEAQIALTKPSAYVEAAGFLRKMGKLMSKHNMATQWDAYIRALRHDHSRKPRLMEVLDGLPPAGKEIARQTGQNKK
jgi:uncharacterized Zn finger protein